MEAGVTGRSCVLVIVAETKSTAWLKLMGIHLDRASRDSPKDMEKVT